MKVNTRGWGAGEVSGWEADLMVAHLCDGDQPLRGAWRSRGYMVHGDTDTHRRATRRAYNERSNSRKDWFIDPKTGELFLNVPVM